MDNVKDTKIIQSDQISGEKHAEKTTNNNDITEAENLNTYNDKKKDLNKEEQTSPTNKIDVVNLKTRRRKPAVTHKVLCFDSDDADVESDGTNKEDHDMEFDSCGKPVSLPDGTMYLEPEAVDDSKRKSIPIAKSGPCCTVCGEVIRRTSGGYARSHPHLKVLVCKTCYCYYQCVPIERDDNGTDNQCLWCGEGGSLLCCDNCPHAFCSECIRRNLGRTQLQRIKDPKTNWSCLVCEPCPIRPLIVECQRALGEITPEKPNSRSLIGGNFRGSQRKFLRDVQTSNGDYFQTCPEAVSEVLLRTLTVLDKLRNHVKELRKRNRAANREQSIELQSRLRTDVARDTDRMLTLFKKAANQCTLLARRRTSEYSDRPRVRRINISNQVGPQEVITIDSSEDERKQIRNTKNKNKKRRNSDNESCEEQQKLSSSTVDTSDLISSDESAKESIKVDMRKIYQKLKKRRSLRKARKRAKEKLDMEESNMEDEPNLILPSQDGTNDPHETTNNDALINTSDIDAGEFIDEEEAVTSTMKNIRAAIGRVQQTRESGHQNLNKRSQKKEKESNSNLGSSSLVDRIMDSSDENSESDSHQISDQFSAEEYQSHALNPNKEKSYVSDSSSVISEEDSPDSDLEGLGENKIKEKSTRKASNESKRKSERRPYDKLLDARINDTEDEGVDSGDRLKRSRNSLAINSDDSNDSDDKNDLTVERIKINTIDGENKSNESNEKNKKIKEKRRERKQKKKDESSGEDPNKLTDESDAGVNKKKRRRKRTIITISSSEEDFGKDNLSKKKRRVTCGSSSDSDIEEIDVKGTPGKRKDIKKIIKDKKLDSDTKAAGKEEEERRRRVKERQLLYNTIVEDVGQKCPVTTKLELDPPNVIVHQNIIRLLKPHQVEAVKFLWECVCESVDRVRDNDPGSGAILAHCMGLGKTLSIIAFVHTIMTEKLLNFTRCLVVCPLNTVLNWKDEWVTWQGHLKDPKLELNVLELSSLKNSANRVIEIENWWRRGGVLIIGYEMFRNLAQHKWIKKKSQKDLLTKCLIDPGPDLFVADEGHVLKNASSALSQCIAGVKTKRKIVLTGTPLQNNLLEYHCMVDLVKKRLLGTKKEFCNRFVNPITNGQCADSTPRDVKLMKRRAHVLHETLAGCVQRRDYRALTSFLPPKYEYVVYVQLGKIQIKLYEEYLKRKIGFGEVRNRGASLFSDYQFLMRIWSHPWQLKMNEIRQEAKRLFNDDSMEEFIDDNSVGTSEASQSTDTNNEDDDCLILSDSDNGKRKTRSMKKKNSPSDTEKSEEENTYVNKFSTKRTRRNQFDDVKDEGDEVERLPLSNEWWADHMDEEMKNCVEASGKLLLLTRLLVLCESIGDKVIVFSQSILTLNFIEHILKVWHEAGIEENKNDEEKKIAKEFLKQASDGVQANWIPNVDYFRFDGSTPAHLRKRWATIFNDIENTRSRLFLISTKAGGLGINLIGANRVVILDASWNPSHDVQSIFRVYRFGQTKPCYVYRLLAYGTMEQKIYERQVTKLSLSHRVVDEQQIDRHFTAADLQELYNFRPIPEVEPTPPVPKDRLLAELISELKNHVIDIKEHDSLLEERPEESLTEEERKAAWEEYEQEKEGVRTAVLAAGSTMGLGMGAPGMGMSLAQHQLLMQQPMTTPTTFQVQELARNIVAKTPNITQEELQKQLRILIQQQYIEQQQHMLRWQQAIYQQAAMARK